MNATHARFYRKHGPDPFAVGARRGVLTILAQVSDAPVKARRWLVRYDCCGLETTRGYATLLAFINDPPSRCERCNRRGPNADRRRDRKAAPVPGAAPAPSVPWLGHAALASADPAAAWPRPPSLVGQAPVVWGVQP